jgi:hypothetical protein
MIALLAAVEAVALAVLVWGARDVFGRSRRR